MSKTYPLLSFGRAIELAKNGHAVSAAHWDLVDRLTGIGAAMQVPTDQIWSPENRRMSAIMNGTNGVSTVAPYMTKFTRHGIVNYIPTNEDMYAAWMLSDVYPRLIKLEKDPEESDDVNFTFELMSQDQHLNQDLPFADLYLKNMVGFGTKTFFVSADDKVNKVNAVIYDYLASHANDRCVTISYDGFTLDDAFFDKNEWMDYCSSDAAKHEFIEIHTRNFDLDLHIYDVASPVNIFIDIDSLQLLDLPTGDTALDCIIHQCVSMSEHNPNINWIAVSMNDEISKSKVEEAN